MKIVVQSEKSLNFTQDERAFLRLLYSIGYRWVARSRYKVLCFYDVKPNKSKGNWYADGSVGSKAVLNLFPQITWKQNEPIEIERYISG